MDSFWRDLVSFTWNLRTSEGRDAIGAMLEARLDDTDPSGFATLEPATEDGGVVSALIEFRTAVGTGKGHLRISRGDDGEDRAWTLLTTLRELTGHEEPQGTRRVMGAVHGQSEDPRSWAERREAKERELGRSIQPHTLIIGGGQGGIALGARLRQLGVPAIVLDRHERPGDQWRGRYSPSACTIPSGTTTCRTSPSRRTGRSSRPRTRSVTGSSSTHGSWRLFLMESARMGVRYHYM